MQNKKHIALRWTALAAVLLNVAWNYFSERIDFGAGSMRAISDDYASLFTPAPYAFAIWGLIYAALIVYAVVPLLPSQRSAARFDRLSVPLIAVNVLMGVWIVCFRTRNLSLSVLVIGAALSASIVLFTRAHTSVESRVARMRFTIPFALLAGWLSVATIANVTLWLVSIFGRDLAPGAVPWAAIMISVSVCLAGVVAQRFREITYPCVVAWALFAIAIHDRDESLVITNYAYMAAIASLLFAVWSAYLRASVRKHALRLQTRN